MMHVPLAADRRQQILELAGQQTAVRVSELAERFGVSPMTVRRDIDALEVEHRIERVHGGARLPAPFGLGEPEPGEKAKRQRREKGAIAAAAVQLVSPDSAIAIGAGTTTLAFARALAGATALGSLTVVTNAPSVAAEFDSAERFTVILTGGVRTKSGALVGPVATSSIASLNVRAVFLGCHGLDVESGATAPNLPEAEVNRCLMARAATVALLADSSKWAATGLATFAALDQIDVLVSDAAPPEAMRAAEERVRRVVVAGRGGRASALVE